MGPETRTICGRGYSGRGAVPAETKPVHAVVKSVPLLCESPAPSQQQQQQSVSARVRNAVKRGHRAHALISDDLGVAAGARNGCVTAQGGLRPAHCVAPSPRTLPCCEHDPPTQASSGALRLAVDDRGVGRHDTAMDAAGVDVVARVVAPDFHSAVGRRWLDAAWGAAERPPPRCGGRPVRGHQRRRLLLLLLRLRLRLVLGLDYKGRDQGQQLHGVPSTATAAAPAGPAQPSVGI